MSRKKPTVETTQLRLFGDDMEPINPVNAPVAILEDWLTVGSYVVREDGSLGVIDVNEEGEIEQIAAGVLERDVPVVIGLVGLRDAARRIYYAEMADAPDFQLDELRCDLSRRYDEFVSRFGLINKVRYERREDGVRAIRPNLESFRLDPDYYTVEGLEAPVPVEGEEVFGDDGRAVTTYEKAPIFNRRTLRMRTVPTRADSLADALQVCLEFRNGVDLHYIASLAGVPVAKAIEGLKGQIFHDPESGQWLVAARYLSGPVRRKLALAERAAEKDPAYQGNVEALRAVQPVDIPAEDIAVSLGSPFIEEGDIRDFVAHLLNAQLPEVRLSRIDQGTWQVGLSNRAKESLENRRLWGVEPRKIEGRSSRHMAKGNDLIAMALNNQVPRLTRWSPTPENPDRYVVDEEKTAEAIAKIGEIEDTFTAWLWADPVRKARLVKRYNELNNDNVPQVHSGDHMTFPGMSEAIVPMGHQKEAVAQILQDPNTYVVHEVGFGKTLVQAAGMVEAIRTGRASKCLWITPNNMVDEAARQFRAAYPHIRIMVGTSEVLEGEGLMRFLMRIKHSDAPIVLMPHHRFRDAQISLTEKIAVLDEQIEATRQYTGEGRRIANARIAAFMRERNAIEWQLRVLEGFTRNAQGQVERVIETPEMRSERMAKLARYERLALDSLGFDMFVVDEVHEGKGIPFESNNSAVGGRTSQLGTRMFDMVRAVQRKKGKVVIATATPVVNQLVPEIFNALMLVAPDILRDMGIDHPDTFMAQFAEKVMRVEMDPAGTLKVRLRVARLKNALEASNLFRMRANVHLDPREIGLKIPRIAGDTWTNVHVEPSEWVEQQNETIRERLQAIQNRQDERRQGVRGRREAVDLGLAEGEANGVADGQEAEAEPEAPRDHLFKIYNDATALSIHPRLYDPEAPEDLRTKIHDMAERVGRIYREDERLTQLVFCDRTGDDMLVYEAIRQTLAREGVDPDTVVFAQDAEIHERARLCADMNGSENIDEPPPIRVLIASRKIAGVGWNIQRRLKAIHNYDLPWNPSALRQGNGRALRQGNWNEEVEILFYLYPRSMDTVRLDRLLLKAEGQDAFFGGTLKTRYVDDNDGMSIPLREALAAHASDGRVARRLMLQTEIQRLKSRLAFKRQAGADTRFERVDYERKIADLEKEIEFKREWLARHVSTKQDDFVFFPASGEEPIFDRNDAAHYFHEVYRDASENRSMEEEIRRPIGTLGGHFYEVVIGVGGGVELHANGMRTKVSVWGFGEIDTRALLRAALDMAGDIKRYLGSDIHWLRDKHVKLASLSDLDYGVGAVQQELERMQAELAQIDRELGLDQDPEEAEAAEQPRQLPPPEGIPLPAPRRAPAPERYMQALQEDGGVAVEVAVPDEDEDIVPTPPPVHVDPEEQARRIYRDAAARARRTLLGR